MRPNHKGLEHQVERLEHSSGAQRSHGKVMSRGAVESVWSVERPLWGGIGNRPNEKEIGG